MQTGLFISVTLKFRCFYKISLNAEQIPQRAAWPWSTRSAVRAAPSSLPPAPPGHGHSGRQELPNRRPEPHRECSPGESALQSHRTLLVGLLAAQSSPGRHPLVPPCPSSPGSQGHCVKVVTGTLGVSFPRLPLRPGCWGWALEPRDHPLAGVLGPDPASSLHFSFTRCLLSKARFPGARPRPIL